MLQRPTRFLFPLHWLRVNPPFLKGHLPNETIDPWAKRDEWRTAPEFSNETILKNFAPGLGIATVAFAGYVVWDQTTQKESHESHGSHGHE